MIFIDFILVLLLLYNKITKWSITVVQNKTRTGFPMRVLSLMKFVLKSVSAAAGCGGVGLSVYIAGIISTAVTGSLTSVADIFRYTSTLIAVCLTTGSTSCPLSLSCIGGCAIAVIGSIHAD
jgi:hypothetical protein